MTILEVQAFQLRTADTQTSHKFGARQSLRQHVDDDEIDRAGLRVVEALLTRSRLDDCKTCVPKSGGHEPSNVTVFTDDHDDEIRQRRVVRSGKQRVPRHEPRLRDLSGKVRRETAQQFNPWRLIGFGWTALSR
jgi:hypothetical protein